MLRMPPKIHTAKTICGDPTRRIIALGTRKMPLPITVPITIATAPQSPRSRRSSAISLLFVQQSVIQHVRRGVAHRHCDESTDEHIPGECNMRGELHVEHGELAGYHSGNCAVFTHPFC